MRSLRLLRFLLAALIVPLLVVVVLMVRERPAPHSAQPAATVLPGARAEQIQLTDLSGDVRRFSVEARVVQQNEATGGYRLEGVERLEVEREGGPPLVLSAASGRVEGPPGKSLIRLEGGVVVRMEDEGLRVTLPSLEVDEGAGEARSLGRVTLEDPRFRGSAESVVYGLKDQPTFFRDVSLEKGTDARLAAAEAVLLEGTRDLELRGGVAGGEGRSSLAAERVRVWRNAEGDLERVLATGNVKGGAAAGDAAPVTFEADAAESFFDEAGRLAKARLEGNVVVSERASRLVCSRVLASAIPEADGGWDVWAEGSVHLEGTEPDGVSRLDADSLKAVLDRAGAIRSGEATGRVRFDGRETSGEASAATLAGSGAQSRITLRSGAGGRARLAGGRSRVAADEIVTDAAGTRLQAEGRVEATLLPGHGTGAARDEGALFRGDEAVHFVSSSMTSEREDVKFEGTVRAWQGERNLAAESVAVRRVPEELHASGKVSTRIPRAAAAAVSEADYVRVSADSLDYDSAARSAVYTGQVRVRQAEGWLEAARVEVDFSSGGGEIREMRAQGAVRFEFRSHAGQGMPNPVTGEGDRVTYVPAEQTVRLMGDEAPAKVRRSGEQGGTTTGRVLRYRLGDGTLEVESGERDRARIRTSGS